MERISSLNTVVWFYGHLNPACSSSVLFAGGLISEAHRLPLCGPATFSVLLMEVAVRGSGYTHKVSLRNGLAGSQDTHTLTILVSPHFLKQLDWLILH